MTTDDKAYLLSVGRALFADGTTARDVAAQLGSGLVDQGDGFGVRFVPADKRFAKGQVARLPDSDAPSHVELEPDPCATLGLRELVVALGPGSPFPQPHTGATSLAFRAEASPGQPIAVFASVPSGTVVGADAAVTQIVIRRDDSPDGVAPLGPS